MWLTSWWVAWFLNFYGFSHIYKLHGILSNSMNMLWHSMELHQYFREPHGIAWNSTIFHGIPWTSKELHQYFKELHGTPWHSMELHGYSMELHGIPWNSMDTPWILHGYSMDTPWKFCGIPWISMEFHGGISHGWLDMSKLCYVKMLMKVQALM